MRSSCSCWARPRPAWLAPEAVTLVERLVAPLAAPGATVEDALAVARALAAVLDAPALALPAAEPDGMLLLDDLTGGDPLDPWGADASDATSSPEAESRPLDPFALELGPERDEEVTGGHPLTADELRRLLEAGARIGQGRGQSTGGGLPITSLLGKISPNSSTPSGRPSRRPSRRSHVPLRDPRATIMPSSTTSGTT